MKHQMQITVARRNKEPISIAKFGKLSLAERMLGGWFGRVQRVMVIVPEDSVQTIEIKEVKENARRNQKFE